MNKYILEIISFGKEGKKNNVELTEGLNIITGNSKTGKSALLEIVDYCLLNSQNCIPKGIINDESILFVIIIKNKNKKIILSREPYNEPYSGRKQAFINVENENFHEKELQYEYFKERKSLFRQISEISSSLLKELGIKVEKRLYYEEESKRKRVSLRNISSYIFQQQNLIANKYALFYRFEDSLKRKSAIEEFPIFTGMIDQKYYELISELEEIRKKIIKKEKNDKLYEYEKQQLKEKKNNLEKELLGITNGKYLDNIEITLNEEKLSDKINELEISIDELKKKIIQLNLRIYNLKRNLKDLDEVGNKIKNISKAEILLENECPICKNIIDNLNEKAIKIKKGKEKLITMLVSQNKEDSSVYMRINELKKEKIDLLENKCKLEKERDRILDNIFSSEEKNTRRIVIDKKIEIELLKEKIISIAKDFKIRDIDKYSIREKDLENEINRYDLKNKLLKAEHIIERKMTSIAKDFDFEETLGEPNFKLNLKEFDVYQGYLGEKISISSMGSGSNWLTVHLSLFLALNYYFCLLGDKCSILPILFLDQPSQVYFPDKINKNSGDFEKVEKIYRTILDQIEITKKTTGKTPQIIIVDHADNLNMGENRRFETYVKARWKTEGEGFIKNKKRHQFKV